MKKCLSGFLAAVMALQCLGLSALAAPGGEGDTQSTSPAERVYVNSYGGVDRSVDFNAHWRFYLGDAGSAQEPAFNDASWRDVDLPHDYSIEQEYTTAGEAESGYLLGGVGWYRKSFTLSEEWADKVISLDFDGVYMDATVWLNGHQLGTHPYGYTPFSFVLPKEYLHFDAENVIAVKVNHQTPSSRWYSGSGIYRDVKLTVTDPVHVARYGTFVTTPDLEQEYKQEGKNVTVNVETRVSNDGDAPQSVTITHTVYPEDGGAAVRTVTTASPVEIAVGATETIDASLTVTNPTLWQVNVGGMYYVRTEVKVDGAVVDTYDTDFGFRWFKFESDRGFSLNGEYMKLQGMCMHHDQGPLGSEAWYRAMERQVELLQEMGCNSIRIVHNPGAEALIDICNKKGMILVEEIFDGWHIAKNGNSKDYARFFDQTIGGENAIQGGESDMKWSEFDLKATLSRDRNAPSIVAWSLGNEIQEGAGNDGGFPSRANDLITWSRAVDETRPLTFGDNTRDYGSGFAAQISNALTNAGNVASGAIGGTIGGLVGFNYADDDTLDKAHNAHSDWALYGSETASHVNTRGVYDYKGGSQQTANKRLTAYDKSKVGWGATASDAWYRTIINDYCAGEYVWTGFDYIGEPTPWNGTDPGAKGPWPSPKSSYFGVIDTNGLPKDNFWFYQSQWNDRVNTLHILPTWNEDEIVVDGNGNVEVVVYSDARSVELFYVDKTGKEESLGKQTFYDRKSDTEHYTYKSTQANGGGHTNLYMTWSVPYKEGTIKAVAYDDAGNVIQNTEGRSSVTTTGPAFQLHAAADRAEIKADGKDLSYITIDVLDVVGNFVNGAEPEVRLSVTGDGVFLASDNGFQADHTNYTSPIRNALNGQLVAVVQSTDQAGSFTLTAQADGLQSASVTVTTTPVAGSGAKLLTSYELSRNYYVKLGHTPVLPEAVTVNYSDDTSEEKTVTWEAFDASLTEQVGTFAVKGAIQGTLVTATVNVNMLDNVVALLNYSVAIQPGQDLLLPESRPAVLADGTILTASFPVDWELEGFNNTELGVHTIHGSANVLGTALDVTASVRVSKPEVSIGANVAAAAAELTQDLALGDQSDTLEAIRDGSTSALTRSPNPNYWSNYDAAQKGIDTSTITFRYDTAQAMGNAVFYFYADGYSFTLPDGVVLEWSPDGSTWTPLDATWTDETGGGITKRTYRFEAVPAVLFRFTVTNRAGQNPATMKAWSTAITEVELLLSNSSFAPNRSAALTGMSFNGKAVAANELNRKTISTPAYFAEDLTVDSSYNAAFTILPAHENVIRILTESEDHGTRDTYTITLAADGGGYDPADDSRDYPWSKTTGTAGSELKNPQGNEGPARFANDGSTDTYWHSNWSTATADNPADLTSKPEARWYLLTLEDTVTLDALRYLPRPGANNGKVNQYKVEVSTTGGSEPSEWTQVAAGSWTSSMDWKIAVFDRPVEAKYVRLWGVSTYGDAVNKFMSATEIRVCIAPDKTDLSSADVTFDAASFDFTGLPLEPKPTVVLDGKKLTYGLDYKVSYADNVQPGTATCTVTGIVDYSGTVTKTFTINPAEIKVLSYTEGTVKTLAGVAPELPEKVTAQTSAGTDLELDVTWDAVQTDQYANRGSFVVEGSVDGQSLKPIVTVDVIEAVSTAAVSAATPQNIAPNLPKQVTVYFSDGTEKAYNVAWGDGDYSETGTVPVSGTVTLEGGKTIAATASVRVGTGTATGNLALNQSGSTVFPLAVAYVSAGNNNPYAAINGDANKDSRWSDWERAGSHADPKAWLAAVPSGTATPNSFSQNVQLTLNKQTIDQVKITFADEDGGNAGNVTFPDDYEVQYYTGPDVMTIDTRQATVDEDWGNGRVRGLGAEHPLNVAANWTTVAYQGGKPALSNPSNTAQVTVNFTPVSTSIIRVLCTPKSGKWTGISELELYGIETALNSDFTVSAINVGGTDRLNDFDASKHLDINLDLGVELPAITATADNNASITVVPAAELGGTATITVTSEDGSKTETYTITFKAPASAVTAAQAAHGTVTPSKDQAIQGDTVVLTVAPDKGYQLKTLTAQDPGGQKVAVEYNRFTMPGHAVTVTAEFEPITYALTYTLGNGTLPDGQSNPETYTVESGPITLANPVGNTNAFVGWIGTGLTQRTETVTIPTGSIGDRAYTAVYGAYHTVEVAEAAHGSVTASPTQGEQGDVVRLAVTAAEGYELKSLTMADKASPETTTEITGATFGMPDYDVILTPVFRPIEYRISYELNDGSLPGGQSNPDTYTVETETFTLTNPSKDGKVFRGWTGGGSDTPVMEAVVTKGTTGDLSFTALFGDRHAITVTTPDNGTLRTDKSEAVQGETVTITAEADAGYRLKDGTLTVYKTGDLATLVRVKDGRFEMPDYPVTVAAVFEDNASPVPTYTVHVDAGVVNGTIVANPGTAKSGETVTLSTFVEPGYKLEQGSLRVYRTANPDESVDLLGSTFVMPGYDVTVTARFVEDGGTPPPAPDTYQITVESVPHGLVEADKTEAEAGEVVTLTVTADEGCELVPGSLVVHRTGQSAVTVDLSEGKFAMPAYDVTVTAEFRPIPDPVYAVEVDGGITGGTVTADKAEAAENETVVLTVEPDEGYTLTEGSLAVCKTGEPAVQVALSGSAFVMPAFDVTVTAAFEAVPETYAITVDDAMENGTVTAPETAQAGETVAVVVASAEGYKLDTLTVTGDSGDPVDISDNAFVMPEENVTIAASFVEAGEEDLFTVTIAKTRNGALTASPDEAAVGDTVVLTAEPDQGYRLTEGSLEVYEIGGGAVTVTGGAFRMPAGNVIASASFEAIPTYPITAGAEHGTLSTDVDEAEAGASVTLTMEAENGYELVEHSLTVTLTEDESIRIPVVDGTFLMPEGGVTITARFQPVTYTIAYELAGGAVSAPNPTYYTVESEDITLTNPTKDDYLFYGWTGTGLTGATKAVTIPTGSTGDRSYTATWQSIGGGGSGGGGGGGGSSGSSTTTERNPDGSTTKTTVSKATGTVTETTTYPDGTKEVVETKKDGTVTQTVTRKDGTKSEAVVQPDGTVTAEITLPKTPEGAVTLPVTAPVGKSEITVKSASPATVVLPVKDAAISTVAVLVKEDGTEEIVKSSVLTEEGLVFQVPGDATVKLMDNAKEFDDVAEGHWASEAVAFVTSRELFNGTGEAAFDPAVPMSRAMLVTVLARLDGRDTAGGETWYSEAQAWGVEQGITDGTNMEAVITRESLAVMLYRYAGAPKAEGEGRTFSDGEDVSAWAAEAMDWAVKTGILSGKDGDRLDPQGEATRAEVATMLQRFLTHAAQ